MVARAAVLLFALYLTSRSLAGIVTDFMLGSLADAAALLCCDCPHAPWCAASALACVADSVSHFLAQHPVFLVLPGY